jgi:hypothetical protein
MRFSCRCSLRIQKKPPIYRLSRIKLLFLGFIAYAVVEPIAAVVSAQTNNTGVSVVTYHNDDQRTGWNPRESTLTPASVASGNFGQIASAVLDDQVDGQPLIVPQQKITGNGFHTVVYVATRNNSVYAIDALSAAILVTRNLGAPVLASLGSCDADHTREGIVGTGTIDTGLQRLYVIDHVLVNGQTVLQLHALNLQNLQDIPGSPVTITASHKLVDGSLLQFNPLVQRQRPALLESQGNIYAAFGSCDPLSSTARGWVLGWNATTLAPLASNELVDSLVSAPNGHGKNYFLASIWMSGYGVAADQLGNIYFTTGNSDPFENTYTGTSNIEESAVKMPPSLNGVSDLFTPSNAFNLDQSDEDYSGGGIMVLPTQPGPLPDLVVASGKDGRLFIMNQNDLGGFHNPDIPANVPIGSCWCGPSYYQGADGVGRVVTSGGSSASDPNTSLVRTWTVNTARTPALIREASSPLLAQTPQDAGFFTSISSHQTNANTAIIWAVGRPTGSDNHVTLYAFNATASKGALSEVWSGAAGFWPNLNHNANLVPTVANGKVYVASYKQLAIFGLKASPAAALVQMTRPPAMIGQRPAFWGTIESVHGSRIVLALRTGELLPVDLREALKEGTTMMPMVGRNVAVTGTLNTHGILEARSMWRAKGPESWGPDYPNGIPQEAPQN